MTQPTGMTHCSGISMEKFGNNYGTRSTSRTPCPLVLTRVPVFLGVFLFVFLNSLCGDIHELSLKSRRFHHSGHDTRHTPHKLNGSGWSFRVVCLRGLALLKVT